MASVDLGKGYVQIVPSAEGISGSVSKTLDPEAQKAGVSAGNKIAHAMGGRLQSIGGGLMKAGAIATAVSVPIVAGIKKSLDAYKVQSAAENKLVEIYKTRMGVSKKAAEATIEYAGALQKEGVIGDEVTLSGAQQLATFAKMPKTVNTLLPAMDNLLAQQKGLNATAGDATNIANLMGKVLSGQVGALKRVGISFTEEEEKVLKFGTEEEKAAMLAQVITNNVGNMNKKMAETPEGKIQQMSNALGDMSEQLGGAVAPVLADVANWVSNKIIPHVEKFMNFLTANPALARVLVALVAILAVGGPLVAMIGAVISAVGSIAAVVTAPILGVVAAVIAVGAAFAIAYAKVAPFRKAVNQIAQQVMAAIQPLIPLIISLGKTLIKAFTDIATTLGKSMAPVLQEMMPVIKAVLAGITVYCKGFLTYITVTVKVAAAIIQAVIVVVSSAILGIISVVKKLHAATKTAINNVVKTWNTLKTTTSKVWNAIKATVTSIITSVYSKVRSVVSSIRSVLSFKGISGAVRAAFNAVKNAITSPIQTAKNTLSGIIHTIRGFFPISIGNILSNIHLPKFSVSGGKAPYGIGGKGSLPSFHVSWAAKGGIVDGATLIGAGEKGPEAIVPLDSFWDRLENSKGGDTYNISVTVDAKDLDGIGSIQQFIDMLKRAKAFA